MLGFDPGEETLRGLYFKTRDVLSNKLDEAFLTVLN